MKQDVYKLSLLFDYYGELLTEKQQTCFDLYYNQDLSLSEIAEEAGISRQGVHDTLARAEALLLEFEAKTGCVQRDLRAREAADEIIDAASRLSSIAIAKPLCDKILSAANRIKE